MAYYTDITELPPVAWPGTTGGLIFRWRDAYVGKLYQLYIDGRLSAETNVPAPVANTVKELPYTVSGETVTWEVIAIDPEDSGIDYSASLSYTDSVGSRVQLTWARDQSILELGGYANIYCDFGTGLVVEPGSNMFAMVTAGVLRSQGVGADMVTRVMLGVIPGLSAGSSVLAENPLNSEPIWNFPDGWGMYGFGMGTFGDGPLGEDGNGMGFAVGEFGVGPFGFDSDNISWISEPFPPGVYRFSVRLHDAAGNVDDDSLGDIVVVVDCYPPAPESIDISSYDSGTDVVTLNVTAGTAQMPYQ